MTAKEIVDTYIINNNLLQKCVEYQFSRIKDKSVKQYKDDFLQDLVITLYEYDPAKLEDAHTNNHFNALVTSIIIKQLWSNTSPFYTKYRKFMDKSDDITEEMKDTYGEL
jgi:adenine-specific DNA methylase